MHIDRLTRYHSTIPRQWRNEIKSDTALEGSEEEDVMNNADEESESEPPELIVAPDPLGDNTDSGESSVELLNVPLVDTLTHTSKNDRGPSLPLHDKVTYDKLQAVGRWPSGPVCDEQLIDTPDTDTSDQIADTPQQLPADTLELLHVADLFGEATPLGVTLEALTKHEPSN